MKIMGEHISIIRVDFLNDFLFRFELKNEITNENFCLFVTEEELNDKLMSAKEGASDE